MGRPKTNKNGGRGRGGGTEGGGKKSGGFDFFPVMGPAFCGGGKTGRCFDFPWAGRWEGAPSPL